MFGSVRLVWAVWTGFLTLATLFLAWAWRAPLDRVATRIVADDAYFYLVIARNGVRGVPASFDGSDLTNGFHPLWALFLHPVLGLSGASSPEIDLRIAITVCVLLYVIAAALLYRAATELLDARNGALAIAAFAALVFPAGWYVTEAPLAVCLFAALLFALIKGWGDVYLGMLAGVLVLARLDAAFLVLPMLVVTPSNRSRLIRILLCGACLAPYLGWNLLTFGQLMPISGALKSTFPVPVLTNLPADFGRWSRITAPVLICTATAAILAFAGRESIGSTLSQRRSLIIATTAGLLAFCCYEFFFQKDAAWGLYSWHFSVATAFAVFLFPILTLVGSRGGTRRTSFVGVACGGMLLLSAGQLYGKLATSRGHDRNMSELFESALWVRANTSPAQRIAATDSGLIAYFGERSTVNLDGLANNFDYQDILRRNALEQYLHDKDVQFVCVLGRGRPKDYESFALSIPARLYPDEGVATIHLLKRDEVYRSPLGSVTIWRTSPRRP